METEMETEISSQQNKLTKQTTTSFQNENQKNFNTAKFQTKPRNWEASKWEATTNITRATATITTKRRIKEDAIDRKPFQRRDWRRSLFPFGFKYH